MIEKEITNTDARTKQELLFECSSLGSRLSDEIIKNENLQQENKQLKMINKEYERLDNGKPRGFVITRVDEYDIYDLLRYKENWNKLKEWASNFYNSEEVGWAGCGMRYTLEKMQELEQGSDSNE